MREAANFYKIPGLSEAAAATAVQQLHALDAIVIASPDILAEVKKLTKNQETKEPIN